MARKARIERTTSESTITVELDLDGNAASDYAMSALLEMASRTQTLTTLRLSANAIGEIGARALRLRGEQVAHACGANSSAGAGGRNGSSQWSSSRKANSAIR